MEIKVEDGKFYAYPVEEAQFLLNDSDPDIELSESGFIINRNDLQPVVCDCKINDIKVIRDEYILEIFVNKGEFVYTIVLC